MARNSSALNTRDVPRVFQLPISHLCSPRHLAENLLDGRFDLRVVFQFLNQWDSVRSEFCRITHVSMLLGGTDLVGRTHNGRKPHGENARNPHLQVCERHEGNAPRVPPHLLHVLEDRRCDFLVIHHVVEQAVSCRRAITHNFK